jgi:hypothetical protein
MPLEKYKTSNYEFLFNRSNEQYVLYYTRDGSTYVCKLYPSTITKELILNCLNKKYGYGVYGGQCNSITLKFKFEGPSYKEELEFININIENNTLLNEIINRLIKTTETTSNNFETLIDVTDKHSAILTDTITETVIERTNAISESVTNGFETLIKTTDTTSDNLINLIEGYNKNIEEVDETEIKLNELIDSVRYLSLERINKVINKIDSLEQNKIGKVLESVSQNQKKFNELTDQFQMFVRYSQDRFEKYEKLIEKLTEDKGTKDKPVFDDYA